MALSTRGAARRRAAMAVSKLSGDEAGIIFTQLCNVFDPRVAVAFSSASSGLREPTLALQQQLKADHEAAIALCPKLGLRGCKKLREAKEIHVHQGGLYGALSVADLTTLGTLGSLLPALERLHIRYSAVAHDGVQRLAEGLGAGALPAVTSFALANMHVGDAGATALAAALGRGALPRLKILILCDAAIGNAGLVALAPALRRLPALEGLDLERNPFGDEGIAALVAPPQPPAGAPMAGAPPLPAGALAPLTTALPKLKRLHLHSTQVADAGCAALAAAFNSGALPPLDLLGLGGIPASVAAVDAVYERRQNMRPW